PGHVPGKAGLRRVLQAVADDTVQAVGPHRPLAAGQARLGVYLGLIGLGLALLFVAAGLLNPLALQLAPLAVVVLFGYSLTKRFTSLCHYFVGLALAIAPLAAWVAIAGRVPAQPGPYLLALAVVFWVGGFDIVYATMDLDFDRAAGVFSLPARFGIERSLGLARLSHLAMVACLLGVGLTTPALGRGFGLGTAAAAAILAYEHAIVRPDDLRRVNMAFFTLNGVLGILLLVAGALDLL
ncbi:MAG: UbiA family prenyltransferase, partial [Armatimonadetes bacterium]|nr:UbiA family prenyltransferase [Armatimonadota bacterium]